MSLAAALACASAACGDGANETPPEDSGAAADGAVDGSLADRPDACVRTECGAPADYGDLPVVESGMVEGCTEPPINLSARVPDECGAPNVFAKLSFQQRGRFADGIETGTFTLEEEDLSWNTCAICARLVPWTIDSGACYFATSGTVTIDSLGEVTIVGSIEDVTYRPVDCQTWEPSESDCGSHIDSMPFDAHLVQAGCTD